MSVDWGDEPLVRETWTRARGTRLRLPAGAALIEREGVPILALATGASFDLAVERAIEVEISALVDAPYRGGGWQPVIARLELHASAPAEPPRLRPPARRSLVAAASTIALHGALYAATWLAPALVDVDDGQIDRDEMTLRQIDFEELVAVDDSSEDDAPVPIDRVKIDPPQEVRYASAEPEPPIDPWPLFLGGATTRLSGCVPAPRVHVVEAGETLATIARAYGIEDWRDLYRSEINSWLVRERPDPDVIYEGDTLYVPDPPGETWCARGPAVGVFFF